MDRIQTHQVAEDLILILIHYALFFAYVHHRQHLFATHGRIVLVVGEDTRHQFHQQHERIQYYYERAHRTRGKAHERFPPGSTDGLRDDLCKNQDQQRRHSRYHAKPRLAKQRRSLHTYTGCAYRIGNRVEREDSRQRTTRVVLVLLHQGSRSIPFLHAKIDITVGGCHQHRFQHGTQKTDAHRTQ